MARDLLARMLRRYRSAAAYADVGEIRVAGIRTGWFETEFRRSPRQFRFVLGFDAEVCVIEADADTCEVRLPSDRITRRGSVNEGVALLSGVSFRSAYLTSHMLMEDVLGRRFLDGLSAAPRTRSEGSTVDIELGPDWLGAEVSLCTSRLELLRFQVPGTSGGAEKPIAVIFKSRTFVHEG